MLQTFLDYDDLVSQVVTHLLHPEYPTSSLVVVPPCLGARELAAAIRDRVADHPCRPPVARVSPDEVPNAEGYVRTLVEQWKERIPLPDRAPGESLEVFLRRLIAVGEAERPLVQVVDRFHTILDCVDHWILGLFRTEESASPRGLMLAAYLPTDVSEGNERSTPRGA